jgi:FdhD protein
MTPTSETVWRSFVGPDGAREGTRTIPEETGIALTYDGSTYAVMMATPGDLEDFAVGFSLTEGIVGSPAEIEEFDIVEEENGIDLRMRLAAPPAKLLAARRRYLAGPVGCGLCGVDSLDDAMRVVPRVVATGAISADTIFAALRTIGPAQVLNRETRAVHAAVYFTEADGLVALREDVGRHNALDKLAGALARSGIVPTRGVVVVTSRLSVELVQKAAMIGAPILVAVSSPTALAVRTAEDSDITVVAVARRDGFEIFTRADRIRQEPARHAAS